MKSINSATATTSDPRRVPVSDANRYAADLLLSEVPTSGTATVALQRYVDDSWLNFLSVAFVGGIATITLPDGSTDSKVDETHIFFWGDVAGCDAMRWTVSAYSSFAGASGPIELTGLINLR